MRLVAGLAMVVGCAAVGTASAQDFGSYSGAEFVDAAAFGGDEAAYATPSGPMIWKLDEVRLTPRSASHIDSLRIGVGGFLHTAGGLPLNLDRNQVGKQAFDVTLIRSWPKALSFDKGPVGIDLSPQLGVGVSTLGTQAQAGAMIRIGRTAREQAAVEALSDMGVKDGTKFGDVGRWYLFAAASGRAVGMNMLRDSGGWDRAGWSTDPTGALIGDAQVGVGWRKGDITSSFGVTYREVRGNHMIFGQQTRDDTVAGVSFTIRPQR